MLSWPYAPTGASRTNDAFWVLQVIEGQTKLVLRDPEIYDAPFHSFSVVPDVTQSGDHSSRCAFL